MYLYRVLVALALLLVASNAQFDAYEDMYGGFDQYGSSFEQQEQERFNDVSAQMDSNVNAGRQSLPDLLPSNVPVTTTTTQQEQVPLQFQGQGDPNQSPNQNQNQNQRDQQMTQVHIKCADYYMLSMSVLPLSDPL